MSNQTWHERLVSEDDTMGWAKFKTPRNESEQLWIDTIKQNFVTKDLDDGIDVKMSSRMFSLLGHVPEVPTEHWESLLFREAKQTLDKLASTFPGIQPPSGCTSISTSISYAKEYYRTELERRYRGASVKDDIPTILGLNPKVHRRGERVRSALMSGFDEPGMKESKIPLYQLCMEYVNGC